MIRKIGIILVLVVFIGGQGLAFASGTGTFTDGDDWNTLTLETWYPSPWNAYEELQLYPKWQHSTCDDDNRGLMYYDDNNTLTGSDDKLMVCRGDQGWKELGGGYWDISGNDISNNNSGIVQVSGFKMSSGAGTGYVLTSDANGNASWQAPSASGKQIFSSNGKFFIPSGVTRVKLTVIGGGGGGGGGADYPGGGGGGAGAFEGIVSVVPGTIIGIEVGRGGEAGLLCRNGGDGTRSWVGFQGGYMVANPGGGGGGNVQNGGGGAFGNVGGTYSGINGGSGGNGSGSCWNPPQVPGSGGTVGATSYSSYKFGVGGVGSAGCGGTCGTPSSAGSGGDGIVIVEWGGSI